MKPVTFRTIGSLAGWLASLLAMGGCGGSPQHPSALEAVELLDVLQENMKRHDPQSYLEYDLGEFRVTRSLGLEQGTLVVRFHLYGVLPVERKSEFQVKWEQFHKRLRDAVISLVQRCDQEQLVTPRMGVLKAEITRQINEMLHSRALRDVVFSELTVERN